MTTTYSPLFDDADLSELAGKMPRPALENWFETQRADDADFSRWNTYDKDSTSVDLPWSDTDIATRIIHDRQFMDLSERYDTTEPTDDEVHAAADRDRLFIILGTVAVTLAQVCFVAYAVRALVW